MSDFIIEHKLVASLILFVTAMLVRWLIVYHLSRLPADEDEMPRRWINSVKNGANLLVVLGLIVIWLSELRYVALSIAAFIVAFVLVTREFIQCFVGALYQASTRAFSVGDWITVGPHTGEVVRSDWLCTTLLEVDMVSMSYGYTGRTLVIPNNQFVANPVQNLNFMRRYMAHSFALVRDADVVNVCEAREFILRQAELYCEPFHAVAQRYNDLIAKRLGVSIVGPEASVRISTNTLGKNVFTVSFFCPTREAVDIEQKITADFMTYWYEALERSRSEMSEEVRRIEAAKLRRIASGAAERVAETE